MRRPAVILAVSLGLSLLIHAAGSAVLWYGGEFAQARPPGRRAAAAVRPIILPPVPPEDAPPPVMPLPEVPEVFGERDGVGEAFNERDVEGTARARMEAEQIQAAATPIPGGASGRPRPKLVEAADVPEGAVVRALTRPPTPAFAPRLPPVIGRAAADAPEPAEAQTPPDETAAEPRESAAEVRPPEEAESGEVEDAAAPSPVAGVVDMSADGPASAAEGVGGAAGDEPKPPGEASVDAAAREASLVWEDGRVSARAGREFRPANYRGFLTTRNETRFAKLPVVVVARVTVAGDGTVLDVAFERETVSPSFNHALRLMLFASWFEPADSPLGEADVVRLTLVFR